jgi:hypothetical protein
VIRDQTTARFKQSHSNALLSEQQEYAVGSKMKPMKAKMKTTINFYNFVTVYAQPG